MIRSFLNAGLKNAWELGRPFANDKLPAKDVFRLLDFLEAAEAPHDVGFFGTFYEWSEGGARRFGVGITDHWTVTFARQDGQAVDVDLEWHS